ncbi:ATPase [Solibacillus sp. FSL K6-1781]|uniref:ATPase n=1 Tax=Solibacillus sp. FSL K6-1781 TaxID=2921474 RepID=UPI0007FB3D39|nr:ATPase [Solibacillus silvestris]OBW55818.1 ATPase [Solibacillus silvestris]
MVDLDFLIQYGFILLVISITTFVLSMYFRKKPKVDKGFKFAYHGLSYRRKFLRTIYSIPFCIFPLAIIYYFERFSANFIFVTLLLVIVFVFQMSYNYIKWKKED